MSKFYSAGLAGLDASGNVVASAGFSHANARRIKETKKTLKRAFPEIIRFRKVKGESVKENPRKKTVRRKHVTAKRRVVKRETLKRNPVRPLPVKHLWTIEASFPRKSAVWWHFTNDCTFADTGGNRMLFHSAADAARRMNLIKKVHGALLRNEGCERLRVSRYQ